MRVLLVGGLGYIGSELIERYKAANTDDLHVDIIDKRFVPHILAGLPDNFSFVHGDIKDDRSISLLLDKEPDIVYLLAAEVQAETSIDRESSIWETNYEAIVRVADKCPSKSRLIFASTGNVFGGVDESEKFMNLTEEDAPRPKYPYAESKRAVEKYLLGSGKNFIVCRFGTNYGYSPGVRFNLVTNNFIKRSLEGETITVHGHGENFRPTVCVKDAVRAMLFLSEKQEACGQIYHVVSENFKIKDLAEKAALFNNSSKIKYIKKVTPFSSYHLSSEKIKKLGFEFQWNVDAAIENMNELFGCLGAR